MRRTVPVVLALAASLTGASSATAQIHCSELPPLTRDGVYPRCSTTELIVAGFPDHMHAQHWYGWETPTDPEGRPYGPGTLCQGRDLRTDLPMPLEMSPGEKRYSRFIVRHNPQYADCDMLPLLEMLEYARVELEDLLGFVADDSLLIINPDGSDEYRRLTGQGVWRLYARRDDRIVMEPFPILLSRTLDGHAAFMIVADWLLDGALEQPLPAWLRQGLIHYLAENGTHLSNYMVEFRPKGPVLMPAPLVEAILGGGVDADDAGDRSNYRRASYSAFLMVWELVENQGGIEALRDFLGRAAEGMDLDRAATSVYGLDMAGLTALLDAATLGEPTGKPMPGHRPHLQP